MSFKKLLDKAKAGVEEFSQKAEARAQGASATPTDPPLPASQAPSPQHIMQHRFQRGVNVGSLFALEKWLTPSLFEGCKKSGSEIDFVESLGKDQAKARLERHWGGFIDEGDFQWMEGQGINSIRLPIGYYHFLPGSSDAATRDLMKDTEYAKHADVYAGAWQHVKRIIDTAAKHDIGVLVDLHAAPGAQNKDDHSGLSAGKAGLWDGHHAKSNQRKTVQILVALAKEVASMPNVVGLELLNEPQNSMALQGFYEEAIGAIRGAGVSSLPLYVGDAWDTQHYSGWLSKRRDLGFVVLDHHLYRCFTPEDHKQSADEHAAKLHPSGGGTAGWLGQQSSACGKSLIVGEWSAALNPASLPRQGAEEAQRKYATAQLACYDAHAAGHFFWTLKKEGSPDAGWCLYSAIEKGVLPQRLGAPSNPPNVDALRGRRDDACKAAFDAHVGYWSQHGGGKQMEHWRYEAGFRQGWDDAVAFASHQGKGSRIGFRTQWIATRTKGHEQEKGSGASLWEFEHGMTAALDQFDREAS